MKKFFALVVVLVLLGSAAYAEKSAFAPLKSKMSLGFNFSESEVTARIWPTDSIGVQGGLGFVMRGDVMDLGVSGGMVIPMNETGNLSFNLIPGLKFLYGRSGSVSNTIDFMGGAELEIEVLLGAISDRLSIASGIGFWIGVDINSVTVAGNTTTDTKAVLDLAKEFGFKALELRYYF